MPEVWELSEACGTYRPPVSHIEQLWVDRRLGFNMGVCPLDTDGDGNCAFRWCPWCTENGHR